jgi:protein aurora borealis
MDCQLRHQQIHLEDEVMETSRISMSVGRLKMKCDGSAQTVLTFPPILPNDIENLLKPYFSYTVVRSSLT